MLKQLIHFSLYSQCGIISAYSVCLSISSAKLNSLIDTYSFPLLYAVALPLYNLTTIILLCSFKKLSVAFICLQRQMFRSKLERKNYVHTTSSNLITIKTQESFSLLSNLLKDQPICIENLGPKKVLDTITDFNICKIHKTLHIDLL